MIVEKEVVKIKVFYELSTLLTEIPSDYSSKCSNKIEYFNFMNSISSLLPKKTVQKNTLLRQKTRFIFSIKSLTND